LSIFNELKRRNVLRVALAYIAVSWLLIQVVETLFPIYGLSDAAIRLVVAIPGVGFIPVLVFAWVFELTPEGLKRDSEVDRSDTRAAESDKTLDRIILVVLALALGYFTFDKFVLDPARDVEMVEEATEQALNRARVKSYGDKSVAVLPFLNMSDDASNEYFSEGISEEILNALCPGRQRCAHHQDQQPTRKTTSNPTLAIHLISPSAWWKFPNGNHGGFVLDLFQQSIQNIDQFVFGSWPKGKIVSAKNHCN